MHSTDLYKTPPSEALRTFFYFFKYQKRDFVFLVVARVFSDDVLECRLKTVKGLNF